MSKPKISVNKLGEYLTATPSRRKRIVEDQQQPKPFIVTRYSDAREHIVNYLAGNMKDDEVLLQAANELKQRGAGSDFVEQDRQASADAIDNFLEIVDELDLENLLVEGTDPNYPSSMDVSGVAISMRPDAILRDPTSGKVLGCVKLHFPKSNPLTHQGAEYVATALRIHLENVEGASGLNHEKCIVVDVPSKQVVNAPKAFKRKMNDIAAACEEIDARWKDKS